MLYVLLMFVLQGYKSFFFVQGSRKHFYNCCLKIRCNGQSAKCYLLLGYESYFIQLNIKGKEGQRKKMGKEKKMLQKR